MPKLGEAEFEDIRARVAAGRLPDALAILEQYRDQARECARLLDATGVDAEKHPAGYKQLQISLRESLRRLNEIMVGMTLDDQAAFLKTRKDLDELNRQLIRELFPRGPRDGESRDPDKKQ